MSRIVERLINTIRVKTDFASRDEHNRQHDNIPKWHWENIVWILQCIFLLYNFSSFHHVHPLEEIIIFICFEENINSFPSNSGIAVQQKFAEIASIQSLRNCIARFHEAWLFIYLEYHGDQIFAFPPCYARYLCNILLIEIFLSSNFFPGNFSISCRNGMKNSSAKRESVMIYCERNERAMALYWNIFVGQRWSEWAWQPRYVMFAF